MPTLPSDHNVFRQESAAIYGLSGPLFSPISPEMVSSGPRDPGSTHAEDKELLRVHDDALPSELLQRLQLAFREEASYWTEIESPR